MGHFSVTMILKRGISVSHNFEMGNFSVKNLKDNVLNNLQQEKKFKDIAVTAVCL